MNRIINRPRPRYQKKVVFLLDEKSQDRNTPHTAETYNFIKTIVDNMLSENNVDTDTIFVGGSKSDFCMWVSGILEFYQFHKIDIKDNTNQFDFDPDFNMPDKFQ